MKTKNFIPFFIFIIIASFNIYANTYYSDPYINNQNTDSLIINELKNKYEIEKLNTLLKEKELLINSYISNIKTLKTLFYLQWAFTLIILVLLLIIYFKTIRNRKLQNKIRDNNNMA